MQAEGLGEDGVGVGEGGGGEEGWVEGDVGAETLRLLFLRVKQGLDFVPDFGIDVAVLHQQVEGPRQGLGGGVATWEGLAKWM